ncbi:aminopeptidase domain protein [Leptospira interrogans serovar Icterohaemorrhagiae str. Verdun HP]|uniref:Aminopeptidase domain protein n=1 Tax=Leptospira interrogans serovar Icterohaemorrhagiae str. Verdun HP TaxID=1049910 RepID=M6RTC6_LEPIR|nr:aminopeptidase domain protein [Leptospira interrogans serovar Icterohaemorrhagiae str. Verdun HP]
MDTRIRITAGYSTLGWFEDPIFSSQIEDTKPYEVASLVFREMAHATVYFREILSLTKVMRVL